MRRWSFSLGSLFVTAALTLAACASDTDPPDPIIDPDSDSGADDVDAGQEKDGAAEVDAGKTAPEAAVCGNGKREEGEECDDGNLLDNDGCSAACTIESTSPEDVCPGTAIPLTAQPGAPQLLRGSVTGSTAGAYNHYGSACGGGSGRDVVYSITAPSSGKAVVRISADFPAIVSARSACEDAASETKCEGVQASTGGQASIEFPLFASAPAFLVVDGYGGTSGDFTLEVEVSTAVCGNGVAELPEECDDGNATNGDGCSADCTLERGGVVNDCPGQPFHLAGLPGLDRKISFAGNTKTQGANTQSSPGCFYWGGPNVVYAVKSDIDGSARAQLHAGYTKANLHARSDCGDSNYQVGCTQRENPGAVEIEFPVRQDEWFYLLVDGHRDGSTDYGGPYSLDVTVSPASCGNGVLDGGEQCDDGNTTSGDGCSSTCRIEPLPAAATCPGHTLALTPKGDHYTATIASSTVGQSSAFGGCGLSTSSTPPDLVYAVTAPIDGLLEANVKGPFNSTVYVRSACSDAASVLDCSYKANATTNPFILEGLGSVPKTARVAVRANETYYVVVDGATSNGAHMSGAFKLDVKVTPAICGNGVIEGAEECDDGGTDDDDGCSSTCELETHGPRTCDAAEEVAIQATGAPGVYSATLKRGTTGYMSAHNFTTTSGHACQAPGREAFFAVTAPEAGVLRATVTSDAFDAVVGLRKPCAASGTPLLCRNDAPKGSPEEVRLPIAAGETMWIVVDTANTTDFGRFALHIEITPSGCGDGFFVPGPEEECDDGNTVSGDGCSATCKLEPMPMADTCPGVDLTLTGSGLSARKGVITLDTSTLLPDYASACGGNAQDGVVRVVPDTSGLLFAEITNLLGGLVHARTVCTDPATEVKKSQYSTCPSVVHETIQFPVTANTEYFLFVDGLDGAAGPATLEVTVTP